MAMFGQMKRPKARHSLSLPYASDDRPLLPDSSHHHGSRFVTIVRIPLPRFGKAAAQAGGASFYPHPPRRPVGRYVHLPLPIPPRVYARIQQLNPVLRLVVLGLGCVGFFLVISLLGGGSVGAAVPALITSAARAKTGTGSSNAVVSAEEIAKIWEWEVMSGHHPSAARVPATVALKSVLLNPVVPARLTKVDNAKGRVFHILGRGPARQYPPAPQGGAEVGFPPRPIAGSVIDLDMVLEKCDFSTGKYARDCLELLRISGGLDHGNRVRDERFVKAMQATYTEYRWDPPVQDWTPLSPSTESHARNTALTLSPPRPVAFAFADLHEADQTCHGDYPRIFHMFWFGPFTDKPYLALLSFLFTQNLGLDKEHPGTTAANGACRPRLWVWIERGSGALTKGFMEELASNPWSAPFVSSRLSQVILFRQWNTAKELDSIPEVAAVWRDVPGLNPTSTDDGGDKAAKATTTKTKAKTAKGAKASSPAPSAPSADYNRLVNLSHLARFVITHRYGGIYLEPDTVFLRDWEELWAYRGQFAYRHSTSDLYNTAVLKMHRHSALSSFLLVTGMRNGGDFSPQAVSRYLQDAQLERLLFRAPDALFDPAWLAVDKKHRGRPPFPAFETFLDFFDGAASPAAEQLGFNGFFRGAYSYHFHNGWWRHVDPTHNYPELGQRFIRGETALREAQKRDSLNPARTAGVKEDRTRAPPSQLKRMENALGDELDLAWATVLKRTFEAYLRGERPNMYGEMLEWGKA